MHCSFSISISTAQQHSSDDDNSDESEHSQPTIEQISRLTQFNREDNLYNGCSNSFENITTADNVQRTLPSDDSQNPNETKSMRSTADNMNNKFIVDSCKEDDASGESMQSVNLHINTIDSSQSLSDNSHFGVPNILKFVVNNDDAVVENKAPLALNEVQTINDNRKPLIEVLSEQNAVEESSKVANCDTHTIESNTEKSESDLNLNENDRIDGVDKCDNREELEHDNTIIKANAGIADSKSSTSDIASTHSQEKPRRLSTITFFCENLHTLIEPYTDENIQ